MRVLTRSDGATPAGTAAERAAWAFYVIAALGSSIGQVWVGVQVPPWPDALPIWLRAVLALPFAAVIDLGGVVCSGFADTRQRLGENAYGWRILSAASVSLGVGINIVGHAAVPYLSIVFGGLGVFAYCVWLLHSAARRRDALRAAGKLADTPPAYGMAQWMRETTVTRRAKTLALQYGYSVYESLSEARTQLRTERRQQALAAHVETLIAARHKDPVLAAIAATTLDIDAVAAELTAQADVAAWARAIGVDLQPPMVALPPGVDTSPRTAGVADGGAARLPGTAVLRQIPTQQGDYDRWREIWLAMRGDPDLSNQDVAVKFTISMRTAQRIRDAGGAGLLDSADTPVARLAGLAASNGHPADLPAGT